MKKRWLYEVCCVPGSRGELDVKFERGFDTVVQIANWREVRPVLVTHWQIMQQVFNGDVSGFLMPASAKAVASL